MTWEPHRGALVTLSNMILTYAGGKEWMMRAPLRVAYQMHYEERVQSNVGTNGRKSSDKLSKDLRGLEVLGIIQRYDGAIHILNFKKLERIASGCFADV